MNILYVVPYVPNKIRVRPYSFIRQLAARGNQVTVLTLSSNAQDEQDAQALRGPCISVRTFPLPAWRSMVNAAVGLATPDPIQSRFSWQPELARSLLDLTRPGGSASYDVIHIEHLRGVRYGQKLLQARQANGTSNHPPIVWDSVDCISYLFEQASRQSQKLQSRIITWLELERTRRYEAKMTGLYKRTLVTSLKDRDALRNLLPSSLLPVAAGGAQIEVVPNGVDLEYFQPQPQNKPQAETLVVSGKMSYHANVSMVRFLVEQIMPRIWAELPRVKLVIVGKDPPREMSALDAHPNIEVTGFVPDIRPYLHAAAVAAAPLTYGAGIQNKILEAMACGIPVVTTSKAASALLARADEDLMIANDPETFARKVVHLMQQPGLRDQIGANGCSYVQKNHNWNEITDQLEDIYRDVAEEN
jgi:polysaccharide biosynthesis protein PslH